jgi:septal ring factor EnvC (AmiA/AmiB activator)
MKLELFKEIEDSNPETAAIFETIRGLDAKIEQALADIEKTLDQARSSFEDAKREYDATLETIENAKKRVQELQKEREIQMQVITAFSAVLHKQRDEFRGLLEQVVEHIADDTAEQVVTDYIQKLEPASDEEGEEEVPVLDDVV